MGRRNHGNVDIWSTDDETSITEDFEIRTVFPSDLVLRDNDLATVRVFRSGDGVVEETDRSNDLAFLKDSKLALGFLAGAKVGRVADDLLGPDNFLSRTDANKLAVFISNDLVYGFIEHVGAAVNGRKTGE